MKIMIQKFASGGSQIGGKYADYAAPYTALDVEPQITKDTSSSSSSSSKKSSSSDELGVKDLFKPFDSLKGLTSDVNYVLKDFSNLLRSKLLTSPTGELDVSTIVSLYTSNLAKVNMLANGWNEYNNVREQLEKTNSLDEVAIDGNGNIMVLTGEGLDKMTVQEYLDAAGAVRALTNHELLDLRYKNPNFAFRDDIYSNISGVGMNAVIDKVNKLVQNIGSTRKEQMSDELSQIAKGIEFVQSLNEEGQDVQQAIGTMKIVREGRATEDQITQAQQALSAVLQALTPQEQALIAYHSLENGGKGVVGMLSDLIGSKTSASIKQTSLISRIWSPTGGAKKSSTTSKTKEDEIKDEKSNPLMQMLQQQGGETRPITWITKDGTQSMGTQGTYYSALNNVKENMSVSAMLSESGIGGILQSIDGITFGNQRIPSENLKDIMFEKDRGGYVAILPCTTDTNGNRIVDLSIMDTYKEIVNSITEPKGTDAWKKSLARKLKDKGMDQYLIDSNTLDDRRFGLFLMIDGVTTDKWKFNTKSEWVEKVDPDPLLEQEMTRALSTNKDKNNYNIDVDDTWGFLEGTWDDIYRGTLYIPLTYNINAAINAYGDQVNITSARSYERDYQDLQGRKVQDADTNIGIDQLQ